jgi:hypothetical protein
LEKAVVGDRRSGHRREQSHWDRNQNPCSYRLTQLIAAHPDIERVAQAAD